MKISFLILLLFLGSCATPPREEPKPKILVSVPPFGALVERLAGKSVEVQLLVPPGTSPHDFEPTPRDAERAIAASLWFRLSEPFEERLIPLLAERSPHCRLIDTTRLVPLISTETHHHDHSHTSFDLHIWTSPRMTLCLIDAFAEELARLVPQEKEAIAARKGALKAELSALDEELARLLHPHRGKVLITSHPALAYLCRDYGLREIALESEGKEALPLQVEALTHHLSKEEVLGVVLEKQYGSRAARHLAQKLGLDVHTIDPYSPDALQEIKLLLEELAS